ncbi:MAG TPA: MarR family transcriptional regulator [Lunatimonas sp.]|nr:MarR family transcriptional regulator [Lunatimonas sp.]
MYTEHLKLENQVCFPLYATSRIITKLYQPYLNELDITYPQYLVLMVLWENDHRNVSDICSCLLLETSTLTPLLKRLERKGFIRRTRSSTDERSIIIELTDKGLQARETAAPIPMKIFESIKSDRISAEDILHVKSVLTEIIKMKA